MDVLFHGALKIKFTVSSMSSHPFSYAFPYFPDPGGDPAAAAAAPLPCQRRHSRWITGSASAINQLLRSVPVLNGLLMDKLLEDAVPETETYA